MVEDGMFFYDDFEELEEYQAIKDDIHKYDDFYLKLRIRIESLKRISVESSDCSQKEIDIALEYLEDAKRKMEKKAPWLIGDHPKEIQLFAPPHG